MFIHNLKYSLKILFRNKMLIFWTFAFPIILGTFFNMAFANIESNEKLDIIDIAIVDNDAFKENEVFKETFKVLSDENNEDRLFETQYVTLAEAKELLEDDKITGYLLLEDSPKIVVNTSGINETVFKFVTEEIIESSDIISKIMESNPSKGNVSSAEQNQFFEQLYKDIQAKKEESNLEDTSSSNLSYTMVEFYTLIAMACLYGGMLGMVSINQNLANMSSKGKRVSVSPTNKGMVVLSSAIASYITQLIGIILLFIYTIFVLHVDYGTNLPLICLLAAVGSLAGLSLGIVIACLFKTNENLKTGIIISITMFGCFLSGMMGITMKYVIDKNVPIINKLNPANMITDGFYSLYYYDTLDRFYFNVISLLIFSFLMILISIICLRRQKYDSI